MPLATNSKIEVKPFKRKRRLYGALIKDRSNGENHYVAYRKRSEIFKMGRPTLSAALRDGSASWALDWDTLQKLRASRVKIVAVYLEETNELYSTWLEYFFDKSKAKIMNYKSRGGELQSYLPVRYFRKLR